MSCSRISESYFSTRRSLFLYVATQILGIAICTPTQALVVISDGFGDGDLNNNGVPLESTDVIGAYSALNGGGTPMVFPSGTPVTGPSDVDDPGDQGIRWTSTSGFSGGGFGDPLALPRIADDSLGVLPETIGNVGFINAVASPAELQNIPALGSGLALGFESKGRGRSVTGFFETDQNYSNGKQGTVELGPNVGDRVTVSFDFRIWMSAPNFNTQATNHVPDFGQLRFGLFEDTDDELGQTNPTAGNSFAPAVWGEDDGLFRGELPGPDATGDAGWYVRVPIQDTNSMASQSLIAPNGASAQIYEETNDIGPFDRFLEGLDGQLVAEPDQTNPDFVNLSVTKRYRLALALERIDAVGGSTDTSAIGNNILATLSATDIDDPISSHFTLSGFNSTGYESEAWDYFSIGVGGASVSNDFDFLIDNFKVEIFGSLVPEPASTVSLVLASMCLMVARRAIRLS